MAHHRNSQTQTITFLVGGCFTPDAGVNVLWQNWEERETAVENAKAEKLKGEAQLAMARIDAEYVDEKMPLLKEELAELEAAVESLSTRKQMLEKRYEMAQLAVKKVEAVTKVEQAEAFAEQSLRSYNKAIEERKFIKDAINNLIPYCKYQEEWLSDPDTASEKIQLEEWTNTMCDRVEKMLMTTGTIGYDHLQSMMALPTYTTIILPHIRRVRDLLLAKGVSVSPLLDELLIPNNIIHRMDGILPKMVTANFDPNDKFTMGNADVRWGALGASRIFLQSKDEPFQVNGQNLLPAMDRTADQPQALPINMTRDQVQAADPLRLAQTVNDGLKLLGATE